MPGTGGSSGAPLTRRQLRELERQREAREADSADAAPASVEPFAALAADHRPAAEPARPADVQADAAASVTVVLPAADAPVADDRAPSVPSSRREARAARTEEQARPKAGRRAAAAGTGRGRVPTAAVPVATAVAPGAAKNPAKGRSRHMMARGLGYLVMLVVPLIAVATSTPASALLSANDVAAAQIAAAAPAAPDVKKGEQTLAVSGNVSQTTVERDGYGAETIAQVAAETGIRMEATFTNDPNGTIQWPFRVGVHIGDRFGYRNCAGCSTNHHGQDFNPGLGAPIQAIADGVVSYAEDGEGDLGVHMMINHVINGQVVTSVYAHMQHGSMKFKVGDTVHVGDVIGNVGNTGMSTGPHLHFEIRLGGIDGVWVDPLEWLYENTN